MARTCNPRRGVAQSRRDPRRRCSAVQLLALFAFGASLAAIAVHRSPQVPPAPPQTRRVRARPLFIIFWLLLFALSASALWITATGGGGPVTYLAAISFVLSAIGLGLPLWLTPEQPARTVPLQRWPASSPGAITILAVLFGLLGVVVGLGAVIMRPTSADERVLARLVGEIPMETWYLALGLVFACGSVAISLAALAATQADQTSETTR